MVEPASQTAGTVITFGTLSIVGSIFGMQPDALILGLLGGVIALRYAPSMRLFHLSISLMGSMVMAGLFSPIAHVAALNYFPWVKAAGDTVRTASALIIGVSALTAVAVFLGWIKKRGGES